MAPHSQESNGNHYPFISSSFESLSQSHSTMSGTESAPSGSIISIPSSATNNNNNNSSSSNNLLRRSNTMRSSSFYDSNTTNSTNTLSGGYRGGSTRRRTSAVIASSPPLSATKMRELSSSSLSSSFRSGDGTESNLFHGSYSYDAECGTMPSSSSPLPLKAAAAAAATTKTTATTIKSKKAKLALSSSSDIVALSRKRRRKRRRPSTVFWRRATSILFEPSGTAVRSKTQFKAFLIHCIIILTFLVSATSIFISGLMWRPNSSGSSTMDNHQQKSELREVIDPSKVLNATSHQKVFMTNTSSLLEPPHHAPVHTNKAKEHGNTQHTQHPIQQTALHPKQGKTGPLPSIHHKITTETPPHFLSTFPNAPKCSPLKPQEVSFTLVTQFSADRLWMMEHHCKRWQTLHKSLPRNPPISLAVYTEETPSHLLHRLVHELGCAEHRLTVQTLSPSLYDKDIYPVNRLRNMALEPVRTSHVMYVDVDFWESTDLYDRLMDHANTPTAENTNITTWLASDPKLAIVVPAFQINRQCREWRECPEANIPKMPANATQLTKMVMVDRSATAFDPTNRGGHGSTNYKAWFQGDVVDIQCTKSNRYEPYLAFRYCDSLPPFQEQFTGYGKNKMTWVMHLRRLGYNLKQIPTSFVVHYPHLDSKVRMEWNNMPKEMRTPIKDDKTGQMRRKRPDEITDVDWTQYKRGQMDLLYLHFKSWLYSDALSGQMRVPLCDDTIDEEEDANLWVNRDAV